MSDKSACAWFYLVSGCALQKIKEGDIHSDRAEIGIREDFKEGAHRESQVQNVRWVDA